jgi:ketosteroid isomerase-like protein
MAGTGPQEEIRKVLDEMIEALNAGDAGRLRLMLSERPDAIHIGTDGEEWWTSKRLLDATAADVHGESDVRAVAGDLGIHVKGDVAWVEGQARFVRADGAERPVRMTGVLVREDGQWKVVQSHASIGVPNADIFG